MLSKIMAQKIVKGAILNLVGIVIALTTFGAVMTLQMDEHGMVSRCPMVGMTKSLCVDVTAHLRDWQDAFLAAPTQLFFSLLAILGLFTLAWVARERLLGERICLETASLRSRGDPGQRLFDYQTEQFSNGILHPKLF